MLCRQRLLGSSATSGYRSVLSSPSSRTLIPRCLAKSSSVHRAFSALSPHRPLAPSLPALDLLPKPTMHPSLATTQIRNGPRDTYDPSHFVRKRRLGFLARKGTRGGRKVLVRRLRKGRKSLTH